MAGSTSFKQQCPGCEGLVLIKSKDLVGKRVECPKCKERFIVEDPVQRDKKAVIVSGGTNKVVGGGGAGAAEGTRKSITVGKPKPKAPPPDDEDAPKAKANGKSANGKAATKRARDEEEDEDEDTPKKKKKKKKKGEGSNLTLILAGVAVLVLLGAGGFFVVKMMGGKQDSPPANAGGKGADGKGADGKEADGKGPDGKGPDGKGGGGNFGGGGAPAGAEITNLLPKGTQGVFQINFKEFLDSPLGVAAFQTSGAFDDDELRQRLGFSVKALDQVIHAESFTAGWTFTVLHSLRPIDDLEPLKKALGLREDPKERAIKDQDYYEITKNAHWLLGLSRMSLGAPSHIRAVQPQGSEPPLYLRRHNRQTLIVANRMPMREFLNAGGQFEPWGGPKPAPQPNPTPGGQPPGPGGQPYPQPMPGGQPYPQPMPGGQPYPQPQPMPGGQPQPMPGGQPQPMPGGQPQPMPGGQPQPGLAGTTWSGSETLRGFGKLAFEFGAGNSVTMRDAKETTLGNYTSNGAQVTLNFYSGTVVYTGNIAGNQMSGSANNGRNSWSWTVSRQGGGRQGTPGQPPPRTQPPPMTDRPGGDMQPGGMQPMPGGMQPGGMQPGGMQPGGMQPGGPPPPPRTFESYTTIHPSLRALLEEMDKKSAGDRVIFIAASDMDAAARSIIKRPEDGDRVLWRVRPLWDVTHMLEERTKRITYLGTALHMKDQMVYAFQNTMLCPNERDAKALKGDLKEKVAVDLTRMFRLLLNHKVEITEEEQPPPPFNPNPGGFPGFPGGMNPEQQPFPGGMPPGGMPPGGMPPFPGRPGDPNQPPGQLPKDKEEEVKSSRILVVQNQAKVQFRVDLVMNKAAFDTFTSVLQVVMAGLRTEIDVVEGLVRRHDLALAGKQLGEKGLTDRNVLPGNFPPGTFKRPLTSRRSSRDPGQRVSWMAGLLPYMGRQSLYSQIRFDQSWKDPANWFATRTVIPEFLDPSFPRESRLIAPPGLPLEAAGTHYVGLAGIGPESLEWAADDPEALGKLGIFGYDRGISLKEIKDSRGGLANTILMIRTPHDGPAGVTPWMAGGGSTIRAVPEKNSLEPFLSREGDGKRGTYVSMTDGSVRYLKEGMSDEVFKALATVKAPLPEDFDLEKEAPQVAAPKKGEQPPVKKQPPIKLPPIKEEPKDPSAPAGWRVYAPPGGRCTLLLPEGPEVRQGDTLPLPGGGKAPVTGFLVQKGTGAYGIAFGDLPPGTVQKGQEDKFFAFVIGKATEKLPGAKMTADKPMPLGQHPGREVTFEAGQIGQIRGRVYLVDQRLYQLLVLGPADMVNSPETDRFMQSFKLGAGAPADEGAPKGGVEQAEWKDYSPPGAGCTVLMPPGQVIPLTQDVPTPQGKTKLHVHAVQKDLTTGYALMYSDLPPGTAGPGREEAILDGARNGVASKVPGARLISEKKITLGPYPGRDLTVDLPKLGLVRVRIYLAGNRLYQVAVSGNNAFVTSPDAERFLGSLKITGK